MWYFYLVHDKKKRKFKRKGKENPFFLQNAGSAHWYPPQSRWIWFIQYNDLIGLKTILLYIMWYDWLILWLWLWPGFHFRRSWTNMASVDNKQWQKDAADQNFDYMFKLLIIGNSAVGKTSFLFRYADDSFTSAFVSTVGIDFKVKTVFRNDKRVKLQIWDTGLPRI